MARLCATALPARANKSKPLITVSQTLLIAPLHVRRTLGAEEGVSKSHTGLLWPVIKGRHEEALRVPQARQAKGREAAVARVLGECTLQFDVILASNCKTRRAVLAGAARNANPFHSPIINLEYRQAGILSELLLLVFRWVRVLQGTGGEEGGKRERVTTCAHLAG